MGKHHLLDDLVVPFVRWNHVCLSSIKGLAFYRGLYAP
jgi:hypothetical protein